MFIICFLFLVSPFYFYFFIFYGLTHHPPPATRHPLPATRHPSPAEKSCRFCLRVRSAGGGGESYFPYIPLNEIQTMFSQPAKRLAMLLPADLCTDHAITSKT